MAKILAHCPVCEGKLGITEISCKGCNTRISGNFDTCRFCQLAPDHLAFIEVFLRCEGNISRVEKELGISYPTVRNRLTLALAALNFLGNEGERMPPIPMPPVPPLTPVSDSERRYILEALARGEISAEDAAIALRDLK